MTVQANPAPLGLAWQTPHVGPAPVAELRCQNRRSARSSSAEKVVLKPRNCVPQITVWQRVLQQLLRVRGVGSPSPASPSPRTSAPQTPSPSPAVPVQSPAVPWTSPPSRMSPRRLAIPRRPAGRCPGTSPPSHAVRRSSPRRPCRLGAVPGRPQDVPVIPGHPAGRPPDVPSTQAVPGCPADPASPAIIRPLSHWRVVAGLTGALP
jgi:hypothetical protein